MFYVCIDYTNKTEFYFSAPQTWILWAVIDLHDYLMYFLINIFIIVVVFTVMCLYVQQSTFWQFEFFYNIVRKYLKSLKLYVDTTDRDKYIVYLYNKYKLENFNHAPVLEFFWTITPTAMLFLMGWPSFKVLYAMEQLIDPIHTILIIGNQWFWSYHYSDYDIVSDLIMQLDSCTVIEEFCAAAIVNLELYLEVENINKKKILHSLSKYLRKFEESKIMYDCVILSDENLPKGYPRLLSTDQVLVLPAYVSVRLLVTSVDVIHSWALPSHGIKMDAIPGRINQINFLSHTIGTYWGQCSELCGINHGFMPIEVRVMFLDDYLTFISLNISFRHDKMISVIEKFLIAYIKREEEKALLLFAFNEMDSFVFENTHPDRPEVNFFEGKFLWQGDFWLNSIIEDKKTIYKFWDEFYPLFKNDPTMPQTPEESYQRRIESYKAMKEWWRDRPNHEDFWH